MTLIDKGDPSAYYEEIAPTPDEAAELVNRTGDPDAADSVFIRREPNDWEDPDARLQAGNQTIRYSYADGKCYTLTGEPLPSKYAEQARQLGLVPSGTAEDDESLKRLIAENEPFIHEEDITLMRREEGDDD